MYLDTNAFDKELTQFALKQKGLSLDRIRSIFHLSVQYKFKLPERYNEDGDLIAFFLLALGQHESGLYPMACSSVSSASGIFQMIDSTRINYSSPNMTVFDYFLNPVNQLDLAVKMLIDGLDSYIAKTKVKSKQPSTVINKIQFPFTFLFLYWFCPDAAVKFDPQTSLSTRLVDLGSTACNEAWLSQNLHNLTLGGYLEDLMINGVLPNFKLSNQQLKMSHGRLVNLIENQFKFGIKKNVLTVPSKVMSLFSGPEFVSYIDRWLRFTFNKPDPVAQRYVDNMIKILRSQGMNYPTLPDHLMSKEVNDLVYLMPTGYSMFELVTNSDFVDLVNYILKNWSFAALKGYSFDEALESMRTSLTTEFILKSDHGSYQAIDVERALKWWVRILDESGYYKPNLTKPNSTKSIIKVQAPIATSDSKDSNNKKLMSELNELVASIHGGSDRSSDNRSLNEQVNKSPDYRVIYQIKKRGRCYDNKEVVKPKSSQRHSVKSDSWVE